MANILDLVCPPGVGCPLTNGLGLPEILLWVLSFAIIYTAVTKLKIMDKKPGVLVALALSFFVLMAAPAALITALAGMSTGFLALITGLIIVVSVFAMVKPVQILKVKDKDGNEVAQTVDWLTMHSTAVAVVLLVLAGLIFWTYGGAQLIGITSLPVIGAVPWILVIIGAAVLWMLS